jgi:hypothetical protein
VIKTDESGAEEWHYVTGGPGLDQFNDVEELANGDFLCAGRFSQASGGADIFLLWLSPNGVVLDSAIIDRGEDENLSALMIVGDGIVMAGSSDPTNVPRRDLFWAKTDFSGNLLRYREYGPLGSSGRDAIIALPDSGFLLAGQTTTDAYLVRLGATLTPPPCPVADSLVIKHLPGFLANNALHWHCAQSGNYHVYSTTNSNLNTSPPGAGWTLEGTVSGLAGTQGLFVDFIFGDPTLYRRYVVTMECP